MPKSSSVALLSLRGCHQPPGWSQVTALWTVVSSLTQVGRTIPDRHAVDCGGRFLYLMASGAFESRQAPFLFVGFELYIEFFTISYRIEDVEGSGTYSLARNITCHQDNLGLEI